MRYFTPLFVPFNIRNQIMRENCTNGKDIDEIHTSEQYSTLLSYIKEKQIFEAINKRIGKINYSKAKANFAVSNSIDHFKKGQVTTRFDILKRIETRCRFRGNSI